MLELISCPGGGFPLNTSAASGVPVYELAARDDYFFGHFIRARAPTDPAYFACIGSPVFADNGQASECLPI